MSIFKKKISKRNYSRIGYPRFIGGGAGRCTTKFYTIRINIFRI